MSLCSRPAATVLGAGPLRLLPPRRPRRGSRGQDLVLGHHADEPLAPPRATNTKTIAQPGPTDDGQSPGTCWRAEDRDLSVEALDAALSVRAPYWAYPWTCRIVSSISGDANSSVPVSSRGTAKDSPARTREDAASICRACPEREGPEERAQPRRSPHSVRTRCIPPWRKTSRSSMMLS